MPALFSALPPRPGAPIPFRDTLADSAGYWERRRVWYNAALALLAIGWVTLTWPHFKPAFNLESAGKFMILALLANVCYSAAYVVDIPLSRSSFKGVWQQRRGILWLAGTIFATLFACYWIADEIYPFVK